MSKYVTVLSRRAKKWEKLLNSKEGFHKTKKGMKCCFLQLLFSCLFYECKENGRIPYLVSYTIYTHKLRTKLILSYWARSSKCIFILINEDISLMYLREGGSLL